MKFFLISFNAFILLFLDLSAGANQKAKTKFEDRVGDSSQMHSAHQVALTPISPILTSHSKRKADDLFIEGEEKKRKKDLLELHMKDTTSQLHRTKVKEFPLSLPTDHPLSTPTLAEDERKGEYLVKKSRKERKVHKQMVDRIVKSILSKDISTAINKDKSKKKRKHLSKHSLDSKKRSLLKNEQKEEDDRTRHKRQKSLIKKSKHYTAKDLDEKQTKHIKFDQQSTSSLPSSSSTSHDQWAHKCKWDSFEDMQVFQLSKCIDYIAPQEASNPTELKLNDLAKEFLEDTWKMTPAFIQEILQKEYFFHHKPLPLKFLFALLKRVQLSLQSETTIVGLEGRKYLINKHELFNQEAGSSSSSSSSTPAELEKEFNGAPMLSLNDQYFYDRVIVVGDLHGQYWDLWDLFRTHGYPSSVDPKEHPSKYGTSEDTGPIYVFNGDLVDRGRMGHEVLLELLCWKLACPDGIFLNRGNHEDMSLSTHGMAQELVLRYGLERSHHFPPPDHQKSSSSSHKSSLSKSTSTHRRKHKKLFKKAHKLREFVKKNVCPSKQAQFWALSSAFQAVYNAMPLGVRLYQRTLIVHGGISEILPPIEKFLFSLERLQPKSPEYMGLLWSDPTSEDQFKDSEENVPNKYRRGCTSFPPNVTKQFLEKNELSLLVRSHQLQPKGYKLEHDNRVLTIFSCANYEGVAGNIGVVLVIKPENVNPETGSIKLNLNTMIVPLKALHFPLDVPETMYVDFNAHGMPYIAQNIHSEQGGKVNDDKDDVIITGYKQDTEQLHTVIPPLTDLESILEPVSDEQPFEEEGEFQNYLKQVQKKKAQIENKHIKGRVKSLTGDTLTSPILITEDDEFLEREEQEKS